MRFTKTFAFLVSIGVLTGCASKNPLDYPTEVTQKMDIPQVCAEEYNNPLPRVAVVNFTNNSSFGDATVTDSVTDSISRVNTVGASVGNPVVRVGVSTSKIKTKSFTNSATRDVKANLGESVASMIESIVVENGGAEIYSRVDLDKINDELKLQDSGILDNNTIVEFGKLSGANIIITGSIDAVEQKYRGNSEITDSLRRVARTTRNDMFYVFTEFLGIGANVTDGMEVSPKLTIKIIDVATAKILHTMTIEDTIDIGRFPNPTYEQTLEGIKIAIRNALPRLQEDFRRYFSVKGYVTRLKSDGDNLMAQISLGSNNGVKMDDIFDVYTFDEYNDPLKDKEYCDRIKTKFTLEVVNVAQNKAWAKVKSDSNQEIKLLNQVQKRVE